MGISGTQRTKSRSSGGLCLPRCSIGLAITISLWYFVAFTTQPKMCLGPPNAGSLVANFWLRRVLAYQLIAGRQQIALLTLCPYARMGQTGEGPEWEEGKGQ